MICLVEYNSLKKKTYATNDQNSGDYLDQPKLDIKGIVTISSFGGCVDHFL